MAWKDRNSNVGGEVEYNDAFAQIYRLDREQNELNIAFKDLLGFSEHGKRNYVQAFDNVRNILEEIWADLTPEERKEADNLRKEIANIIKYTPPVNRATSKGKLMFNRKIMDELEELLITYRRTMSMLKRKHGYSNPKKEDARFAMLR